jgi:hypothetical protein
MQAFAVAMDADVVSSNVGKHAAAACLHNYWQ